MIAIVLLYVGAVLFCNGLWLIGKISDQEIGIINIFAGAVGALAAAISMVLGAVRDDFGAIVFGAEVLLFAFTYLWVAYNRYAKTDGRGLGWFCLFVAVTAVPTAWLTLAGAGGNVWLTWLGVNWAAWAVLWFLFWLLLAMQRPIAKLTGYVTAIEGVLTGWIPAYLLMMGFMQLPGA